MKLLRDQRGTKHLILAGFLTLASCLQRVGSKPQVNLGKWFTIIEIECPKILIYLWFDVNLTELPNFPHNGEFRFYVPTPNSHLNVIWGIFPKGKMSFLITFSPSPQFFPMVNNYYGEMPTLSEIHFVHGLFVLSKTVIWPWNMGVWVLCQFSSLIFFFPPLATLG